MNRDHQAVRREIPVPGDRSIFVDLEGYDRVRQRSNPLVNEKVAQKIERSVLDASIESRDALNQRIERLDRAWDIDRATMAFFSLATSGVLQLGISRDRRWFRLLTLQLGFLGIHALVGWSPPAFVLRQLGFRTRQELDAEKYALKTLRGDYRQHEHSIT